MNTKIIIFILTVFLTGNICGQGNEDLFTRLQGISNHGVDFFNVDGIEITSRKLDVEFSAKNCAKRFPQLKIKEKELTTSDSSLDFRNYCHVNYKITEKILTFAEKTLWEEYSTK